MSLKHQLGWLHGCATYACAQNGPILGLMPCCCCLKILYTFQTKAPHCHFYWALQIMWSVLSIRPTEMEHWPFPLV